MSSKVTCSSCGWSWNKSDSSKKDLYVCHQCGKDNTMKDGGWLNKFEDAPEAQNGIDGYFQGYVPSTKITKPLVEGIRNNMLNYIQSPLYQKRLGNYSEGDRSNSYQEYVNLIKQQNRANNLKNANIEISPIGNNRDRFAFEERKVQLNNLGTTAGTAHELGHSIFGSDSDLNGSDYANNIMFNASLSPSQYSSFLNEKEIKALNTHSNPNFFKLNQYDPHFDSSLGGISANESYSDLMAVRQLLNENGLTKKFGDDINKQILKKALENKKISENPNFQRMRSKYDLDKIIMLNNTIAQNDNNGINNTPIAQNGIEGTMGGLTDKGFNYNGAWGGTMAMGGSLPGAVGFTYARTQSPAPSNGKYAKKTKASAQNGQEMKYYQEGLDFTPKTISKDGGWLSKYDDGGIIEDDMGQWAHPGLVTKINSNQITMEGVGYPVLGISDTGDTQMMQPGEDYKFDGNSVTEIPMAQDGYSEPDYVTGTSRRAFNKMVGIGNYLVPANAINSAADLAKTKGLDYGATTSGPADAVRHAAASASIASKLPVEFIGKYSPALERAIRIAGANILGGAYELVNPNSEGLLMDIKNNYQGSLIGSIPGLTQSDRNKMLVNQLQKGSLTVNNPKKPKKENGGWLNKYE